MKASTLPITKSLVLALALTTLLFSQVDANPAAIPPESEARKAARANPAEAQLDTIVKAAALVARAAGSSSTVSSSASASTYLPFGTDPIPLEVLTSRLARLLVQTSSSEFSSSGKSGGPGTGPCAPFSTTQNLIRNVLSLYAFGIDGKEFSALDQVFAPDVVANYAAPLGILSGLSAIQETLANSLAPVITQHALTTQFIDVVVPTETSTSTSSSGDKGEHVACSDTAFSATYYTAVHFGTGNLSDQTVTAWGQYQDTWKWKEEYGAPGEGGAWRIVYRNLVKIGPYIGNLAIFAQ